MTPREVYRRKKLLQEGIKSLCIEFEKNTNTVITKIEVWNRNNNNCLSGTRQIFVTSEDSYCIHKGKY